MSTFSTQTANTLLTTTAATTKDNSMSTRQDIPTRTTTNTNTNTNTNSAVDSQDSSSDSSSSPATSPLPNVPRITISSHNNYNQYACIRCRRLKKKCTKELPKCANCDKQSEFCEYVERKNKRKSSSSINPLNIHTLKKLRATVDSSNNHSGSFSSISDTERDDTRIQLPNSPTIQSRSNSTNDSLLLSPSQPIIQLPPIRNKSLSISSTTTTTKSTNTSTTSTAPPSLKSEYLPSLSSYSLQQPSTSITTPSSTGNSSISTYSSSKHTSLSYDTLPSNSASTSTSTAINILPSIPKQVYNIPHYTRDQTIPTSFSTGFQSHFLDLNIPTAQTSATRPRANSKSSLRSLSPTNTHRDANTFQISTPIINTPIDDIKKNNILFQSAPIDSIQYELMMLIAKKIGFIDENMVQILIDLNLDPAFELNFHNLLNFIVFTDSKTMLSKLNLFKQNKFNWNGINKTSDDYFASIEFLLILTSSIILTCYQNENLDNYYYKFTFTMANKFLQRNLFPITNSQILRLTTLFQLISLISHTDLEISCFIQSFLVKYSTKWKLISNIQTTSNTTLTDVEYTNRLFWCIFIFDSFISLTTYEQPGFQLNNIQVPPPLAIVKDEETILQAQNIIINLCKIQSKILTQLYTINNNIHLITDSEKFNILSMLRQDADLWYNDCRHSLSQLSEKTTGFTDSTDSDAFIAQLQNFAAWISQEYYYTLINLFKPSRMFTQPDARNFTVISNATYQNTLLVHDLVIKNAVPLSTSFYTRHATTTLYALLALYRGAFTVAEAETLVEKSTAIWSLSQAPIAKAGLACLSNVAIDTTRTNNTDELLVCGVGDIGAKLKTAITKFVNVLNEHGVDVETDLAYVNLL